MREQEILKRIDVLLTTNPIGHESFGAALRRIASQNGIPHIEKLQDVLTELKQIQILQGTQVGIANNYLNFRNSALHAQWERVERESVASVLGFVQQLLMKHFS